jgi:hypothetical protein
MSLTKKNNCKESIFKLNNNVDMSEWSLLDKRIGDDLNTLETASSSGLSSSDTLESNDIFQTFTLKSSNFKHLTTPNISQLN